MNPMPNRNEIMFVTIMLLAGILIAILPVIV